MKEHHLQYQISQYLKINNIMHFSTDVMSGLQYFNHKDPRRFAFINHHKKSGYFVGQSDLVLILQKRIVFIELKTDKGKQSQEQKDFMDNVKSLGFDYLVWRSIDDAIDFIKDNKGANKTRK